MIPSSSKRQDTQWDDFVQTLGEVGRGLLSARELLLERRAQQECAQKPELLDLLAQYFSDYPNPPHLSGPPGLFQHPVKTAREWGILRSIFTKILTPEVLVGRVDAHLQRLRGGVPNFARVPAYRKQVPRGPQQKAELPQCYWNGLVALKDREIDHPTATKIFRLWHTLGQSEPHASAFCGRGLVREYVDVLTPVVGNILDRSLCSCCQVTWSTMWKGLENQSNRVDEMILMLDTAPRLRKVFPVIGELAEGIQGTRVYQRMQANGGAIRLCQPMLTFTGPVPDYARLSCRPRPPLHVLSASPLPTLNPNPRPNLRLEQPKPERLQPPCREIRETQSLGPSGASLTLILPSRREIRETQSLGGGGVLSPLLPSPLQPSLPPRTSVLVPDLLPRLPGSGVQPRKAAPPSPVQTSLLEGQKAGAAVPAEQPALQSTGCTESQQANAGRAMPHKALQSTVCTSQTLALDHQSPMAPSLADAGSPLLVGTSWLVGVLLDLVTCAAPSLAYALPAIRAQSLADQYTPREAGPDLLVAHSLPATDLSARACSEPWLSLICARRLALPDNRNLLPQDVARAISTVGQPRAYQPRSLCWISAVTSTAVEVGPIQLVPASMSYWADALCCAVWCALRVVPTSRGTSLVRGLARDIDHAGCASSVRQPGERRRATP